MSWGHTFQNAHPSAPFPFRRSSQKLQIYQAQSAWPGGFPSHSVAHWSAFLDQKNVLIPRQELKVSCVHIQHFLRPGTEVLVVEHSTFDGSETRGHRWRSFQRTQTFLLNSSEVFQHLNNITIKWNSPQINFGVTWWSDGLAPAAHLRRCSVWEANEMTGWIISANWVDCGSKKDRACPSSMMKAEDAEWMPASVSWIQLLSKNYPCRKLDKRLSGNGSRYRRILIRIES